MVMITLAIDFDGVIHDDKNPVKGRKMGPPLPDAKMVITHLKDAGCTIIIHTVRGGYPQHVEEWLQYYDIPYDRVTNIKEPADFYIDDKAIRFTNWMDTIAQLKRFL